MSNTPTPSHIDHVSGLAKQSNSATGAEQGVLAAQNQKSSFWDQNDPIIALAPMAGVTDSPFRRICKQYGAPYVWSEFVSVRGLHHNWAKSSELLEYTPEEYPVVMQIFGDEPAYMADAAEKIERAFKPAGIDINCGCPAKKVMRTGAGVALMQHADVVSDMINAISERITTPLSLKTRAGIGNTTVLDFASKLPLEKLAGITVHGRTYEARFSGEIDLPLIRQLKDTVPCKVIANGGIATLADMRRIYDATGVDGYMIGNAALGRPWVFRELTTGIAHEPTWEERVETILLHARYMTDAYGEERGIPMFRKHLLWYLKGLPHIRHLKIALPHIVTQEALVNALQQIQSGEPITLHTR